MSLQAFLPRYQLRSLRPFQEVGGGKRTAQTHVLEKKEVEKDGGSSDDNRSPIGLARRIASQERRGCR
jgi:hypothetical protein